MASIAPALFEGEKQLQLADRDLAVALSFIEGKEFRPLDEDEIRKRLGQSAVKIKAWLDTVSEPFLLDAIYTVSLTMDLSTSKLKVLQEKMPHRELLPTDDDA